MSQLHPNLQTVPLYLLDEQPGPELDMVPFDKLVRRPETKPMSRYHNSKPVDRMLTGLNTNNIHWSVLYVNLPSKVCTVYDPILDSGAIEKAQTIAGSLADLVSFRKRYYLRSYQQSLSAADSQRHSELWGIYIRGCLYVNLQKLACQRMQI